jgi:hypothetical protein
MKFRIAAAAALLVGAATPEPAVKDLGWLAGDWVSQEGERWTEERWAPPRGGVMVGTVLTGRGDEAVGFEFMRVAPGADGAPVFWAAPEGKAAVPFRYDGGGKREARFVNAANDYPNRIVYRRKGNRLTGTITALDGSNSNSWTYRRKGR